MANLKNHNDEVPAKTEKMLLTIQADAAMIYLMTMDALSNRNEKQRDQTIEKIMEYNERIDKELSTDWHE